MAVYSRDDDVPAIRLFRPLAEKGSAKGARRIREDVRKGGRAIQLAASALAGARNDAACEASNYRDCEY